MWITWVALALGGPIAVGHEGVLGPGAVTWTSDLVFDVPAQGVALATPLAAGTTVQGAIPTLQDGRIVALAFPASTRVRLTTTDPLADGLHPPVPAGPALQRVTVDGAALRADPSLGLERRVRHAAPPGLPDRDRRALDRLVGGRARARDQAVYLTGDAVAAAGGVRGELVDAQARAAGLPVVAGGVFAGVVALLWAVFRGLDRAARAEASLAYISREFAPSDASPPVDGEPGVDPRH